MFCLLRIHPQYVCGIAGSSDLATRTARPNNAPFVKFIGIITSGIIAIKHNWPKFMIEKDKLNIFDFGRCGGVTSD